MYINSVQKSNNTIFGTYLGANIQEKILLGKERYLLTEKHLKTIAKIEDDGLNAVLDISDKYKIVKNGKKGILERQKHLTIGDGRNNIVIDELKNVYTPTSSGNKLIFSINKFLNIFSEEFNLAEKVKQGYEKFTASASK